MQEEAKVIRDSLLFNQLLRDLKYASNYQMYNHSQKDDDILFGKATLWTVDVIERKINSLLKLK